MDEREERRLEKRYKRLRWTQHILFWTSIAVAALPAVIVAVNVALTFKSSESGWSLAWFAVIILGIGALLIVGGITRKYQKKIPWALSSAVGSWILTFLIWSLKKIINDAFYISLALTVGCSVALVMSSVSDACKAQADAIEREYKGGHK